jgi:hypothetical protein
MIQRVQSLWLLLAVVFAFLTFKLPFYSGSRKDIVPPNVKLNSSSEIALLILASIVIILCFAALVTFKNRKRQLTITIVNLIFSIVLIVVYFLQIQKFDPGTGTLSLSSLFTLAIPLFLFLAARGIWRDEKLIKSLDRLR